MEGGFARATQIFEVFICMCIYLIMLKVKASKFVFSFLNEQSDS